MADRLRWSRKPRHGTELLCEYVFRPAAHLVVVALAPLRVPPPAVVIAAGATGLVAAYGIGSGSLVAAALLLQLKTVLDNADGQLARATGRVTALGRYLDSESDLLVDAALFAGIGWATGRWVLAAAGFACLTLVLGVNYNAERLYRREHREPSEAMPAATGLAGVLARFYALVYAPQDRLVERFVERRLRGRGPEARLSVPRPCHRRGARQLRPEHAAGRARRLPRGRRAGRLRVGRDRLRRRARTARIPA